MSIDPTMRRVLVAEIESARQIAVHELVHMADAARKAAERITDSASASSLNFLLGSTRDAMVAVARLREAEATLRGAEIAAKAKP